jgi:hypothetical protein
MTSKNLMDWDACAPDQKLPNDGHCREETR